MAGNGDDLLYIISKMSLDSVIVSDDKDILQLIHEPNTMDNRTCIIRRALNDEEWNMDTLKQQGQNIEQFIGCKSIIGDPSDNLPSACSGVGSKNALGLFTLINYCIGNHIQFPDNEKDLDKYCNQLNINKRKAYLNLNIDQYMCNYLMTDLRLVDMDITEDVIIDIQNKIKYNEIDFMKDTEKTEQLNYIIETLQMNSFKPQSLLNRLRELKNMILIEDKDKVSDISKVILNSNTLF